ncbi:hypothetical protein PRIPAC_79976 [Pristionchus pacificus]|nr:hypothetical protein PRIPAC_79976 [Pristionchus pacificus]
MFDTIKKKGVEFTPYIYPELERIYGATFGFYYGTNLEIVTTDPAIIKEVFISQFGNFIARKKIAINMVYPILDGLVQVDHIGSYGAGWKEIRSTISEIFTSSKMKRMHLMFHDQLDNLMNVLSEKSKMNDGIVDIYAEMQAISMDLIGKCALGRKYCVLRTALMNTTNAHANSSQMFSTTSLLFSNFLYSFPSSNIFVDSQSLVKRSTFSFKNSLQTFKAVKGNARKERFAHCPI